MVIGEQPKHERLFERWTFQQVHHRSGDFMTSIFNQVIHILVLDMITRSASREPITLFHTFIKHSEAIYRYLEDTLSYFVIRPMPPYHPVTQSANLGPYLVVHWMQDYLIVSVDSDGSVFQRFC